MEKEASLPTENKGYLTGPKSPVGNHAKYVYIVFGVLLVGIGAIGTAVPLIPTTPFIVLAAICFGRSSPKLHTWFVSTRLYKKSINSFIKSRSMTVKAKVVLLCSITAFMGLSFITMIFLNAPLVAKIILFIIWLCHVAYFGFKVKTIKKIISRLSH